MGSHALCSITYVCVLVCSSYINWYTYVPILVPAPHCYGLRWAIYHGGNSIIAMWTMIGIWLLGRILPLKSE